MDRGSKNMPSGRYRRQIQANIRVFGIAREPTHAIASGMIPERVMKRLKIPAPTMKANIMAHKLMVSITAFLSTIHRVLPLAIAMNTMMRAIKQPKAETSMAVAIPVYSPPIIVMNNNTTPQALPKEKNLSFQL
jgi:hypothetical protein